MLGYRVCPERPLIIADYWFAFTAKSGTSGECIWLEPVVSFFHSQHTRQGEGDCCEALDGP